MAINSTLKTIKQFSFIKNSKSYEYGGCKQRHLGLFKPNQKKIFDSETPDKMCKRRENVDLYYKYNDYFEYDKNVYTVWFRILPMSFSVTLLCIQE